MMGKKRLWLPFLGIAFLALAALAFSGQQGQSEAESGNSDGIRPGLIRIDSAAAFKDLSMPAVRFLHDRHTQALEDRDKDCQTCHPREEGDLLFSFQRSNEPNSAQELKDLYHTECTGCHKERSAEGLSSGPLGEACRKCHVSDTRAVSREQPFVMEKALHYRHLSSSDISYQDEDKNCGACHHKYEEKTDSLYWDKGEEENCRYCHQEDAEDEARPMRAAAHDQCVRCHQQKEDQGTPAGPVTCKGCHGEQAKQEIAEKSRELKKELDGIPRLERGQPNASLMAPFVNSTSGSKEEQQAMTPVPFDHRAHEGYQDTCRVCHHKSLDSCRECHTLSGSQDGDFVQLSQAMHEVQSDRSCTGCHQSQMQESECAGCHQFIPRERITGRDTECNTCHLSRNASIGYKDLAGMSRQMREEKAREFISSRNSTLKLYPEEDIPEEVTIDHLADTYEGARMPHRRIVLSLADKVESNTMAGYFHQSEGTLCQGCHHNSPASREPPSCRSCHGKPFQEREPLKPGLQAAYHQQCMNCHQAMGIEEPADRDCTSCHQESGDKPASDR